jgi:hypothetical protein
MQSGAQVHHRRKTHLRMQPTVRPTKLSKTMNILIKSCSAHHPHKWPPKRIMGCSRRKAKNLCKERIDKEHACRPFVLKLVHKTTVFVSYYCPISLHTSSRSHPRPLLKTAMSTWSIGPIKSPTLTWGQQNGNNIYQCPYCHILLLTGERPGFCCGKNGQYLSSVPSLPPLPEQYAVFLHHPQISSYSRILNLIFSFTSLETTHKFPEMDGPPGFVAI